MSIDPCYREVVPILEVGSGQLMQFSCPLYSDCPSFRGSSNHLSFSPEFFFADPEDPFKVTDEIRSLGLVVCRGTAVVLVCPADSMEQIPNPFIQPETV